MEGNKYRILVVDDDNNILELVKIYLLKEGYEVVLARNGVEALEKMQQDTPHLMVLDIMMPELDGWEVCRKLRNQGNRIPIILLTAKGEDYDKILGLELGADDYLTKPFNPRELLARIKAVLRRLSDEITLPRILCYPGLEVNIDEYSVLLGEKQLTLTKKEIELLWFMASHPNRVFSREILLENIWGYHYTEDFRTVDTHIKRLRKKLFNDKPESDFNWAIKTVWGVGYKFEVTASC